MVDAYYDADGNALCPAATGFTHHVNPWGDIEPCPIIQFAKESIHDERPLDQVFNESEFLRDFRKTAAENTRGCIVLERPDLIEALADRHGAKDSTARKTALAELRANPAACVSVFTQRNSDSGKELGVSVGQENCLPRLWRLRQTFRSQKTGRTLRMPNAPTPEQELGTVEVKTWLRL